MPSKALVIRLVTRPGSAADDGGTQPANEQVEYSPDLVKAKTCVKKADLVLIKCV
jgi:hypothetical protein